MAIARGNRCWRENVGIRHETTIALLKSPAPLCPGLFLHPVVRLEIGRVWRRADPQIARRLQSDRVQIRRKLAATRRFDGIGMRCIILGLFLFFHAAILSPEIASTFAYFAANMGPIIIPAPKSKKASRSLPFHRQKNALY